MWGCKVLKISGKNSFITIDIRDKTNFIYTRIFAKSKI